MKKNKGITLIALVVTIVVLLILAGVSISMLAGDNGIIRQSQRAKEETKIGEEKEQVKLSYSAVIAGNNGQGVTRKQLEDELKKYDDRITVEEDGNNFKVTFPSSNVYTIDKNGKVEEAEKSDVSISLTIKGTKVENPPIPSGFVHVGGSINEGYVISDAQEDENKDVDSDDLKGNQFVWVPVEKDQKITAKVTSKEDITSIVITDPYGDNIKEENNVGKSYNEEIEPTINGEYKIKVTTSKGEASKTLEVYSLYAQNFWTTYEMFFKELEEAAKAENMTVEEFWTQYRAEYGIEMSLEECFNMSNSQYKTKYKETENYETNVNKNGGFYIGRYEAGDSSVSQNRVLNNKGTGTLVIQKNKFVYNYISQTDALSKAKEYATSVTTNATSSLLTGSAWDRTLGWIYETGNKTIEEIVVDSKSWGNYSDDTFSNTTELIKTGQFEQTKANNIYDLAGNVEEWTTEGCYNARFCRGGNGFEKSGFWPACGRSELSSVVMPNNVNSPGFRVALYLQD